MIDVLNANAESPLHLAAQTLTVPAVQALVAHGAALDLPDAKGRSPLHLVCLARARWDNKAAAAARYKCAEILLKAGALSLADASGSTPLHACCDVGDAQCVELLVKSGAAQTTDENGDTPLHVAAAKGHLECMKTLLWVRYETEDGHAYWYNATTGESKWENNERHLEIWSRFLSNAMTTLIGKDFDETTALLNRGFSPNVSDDKGRTPIHHATFNNSIEVVHVLWDAGADVDARDAGGNSPLHVAAATGATEILSFLLSCAASVDDKNNDGDTALHLAAWMGHDACVQCLLDADADTTLRNGHGKDPLANVKDRLPALLKNKTRLFEGRPLKPLKPNVQRILDLLSPSE